MKYEAVYETRLSACGCGGAAGGGERVPKARPTAPGGCRPYLKIEKDQPRFLACQKIADRIGPINSARKSFEILREAVGGNVAERFGVLTLDTHLRMRGLWETGAGETDSVQAPRVPTLQAAIVDDAAAAVIYHVHPAASDRPSEADVEVTRMFDGAFQQVGIVLVDHVIVAVGSRAGFYSFADSMPETLPIPKVKS
jgi:DNA repair protein RadC